MNKLESIVEQYYDEELLKADGFDEAILGVVEDFNMPPRIAYSVKKCIQILMEGNDYFDAMSWTDAMEYFSFNVSGAYVGEKTPLWVQDDFE
jgi:hypothetical protein